MNEKRRTASESGVGLTDLLGGISVDDKLRWSELIQHMTGAVPHKRRSIHGFRNQFCANVGSRDFGEMMTMEEHGLVVAGCRINDGDDQYFHATEKGCAFAGLHKAAIRRAMGKE